MVKVGRSYKGLESHDSEPFLLAEAVEEDVSMKLSILTKVMTLLTRARDSWEYQKRRNGLFLRKQKVGDEGLEPFALGFSYRCYFAVFPVFPTVPAWFAYHCKSLQLPEKRGQNVGTDGHDSPDHRQVEALARPPFHRQILLVVAKQQQVSGGVSVLRMFQLLDYAPVLQGGD